MLNCTKLLLVTILVTNVVACAKKTKGENAEDRQARLESAQAKSSQKLSAQGQPAASWSHEQLNRYEKQLDQLEQIDHDLHGNEQTSANSNYFTSLRRRLQQARATKAKQGQPSSSNI